MWCRLRTRPAHRCRSTTIAGYSVVWPATTLLRRIQAGWKIESVPNADDLPAGVLGHYRSQDEASRLPRSPHGRLEFLRTQKLLRRYLPSPPASVLDVGGGTGIHAAWL